MSQEKPSAFHHCARVSHGIVPLCRTLNSFLLDVPIESTKGEVEGSVTMLQHSKYRGGEGGLEALSLALPTAEAKRYVSV